MIRFVDLPRQTERLKGELLREIEAVLDRADFIGGEAIEDFEAQFARFCGKRHCVAVNSGTDALELALRAHGVRDGEVITAPNSYFSTAMVITKVGARPVFVDIDHRTLNLDASRLEAAITPRTRAIIPVHLCGQPADMEAIREVAERHGLLVIEDCCQAHGAEYRGTRVPVSPTGCFSFYPGKNLGCFGDGGAVVTDDDAIADRLRLLRNDGSRRKYHHEIIGSKSRLDTIQAAVLRVKLPHLAEWNERRRHWASRYRALLEGAVRLPEELPRVRHVYHLFVIAVEDRDGLQQHLQVAGIATVIHYPVPIHLQPAYADEGYKHGDFPVTEWFAEHLLSLPMFPELTDEEVEYVTRSVLEYQARQRPSHAGTSS